MPELRRIDAQSLKSANLHIGEKILLSGYVYTSRDAAHKRIAALLDSGGELPFPLEGAVIYYAGLLLHRLKRLSGLVTLQLPAEWMFIPLGCLTSVWLA